MSRSPRNAKFLGVSPPPSSGCPKTAHLALSLFGTFRTCPFIWNSD